MTKIIYLILINLVTPKARAKHKPFVQQTGLRRFEKNHPNFQKVAQLVCNMKKGQNIYNKVQLEENRKHLHQTTFETLE